MLNTNQEQNEYDDSLYQGDKRKKMIKIIVVVLVIVLVMAGLTFVFLRKKTEPANKQILNTQTENTQSNTVPTVSGITGTEELKKLEEQLAPFADDKDRDGLSAEKEKELGTSDNDSDTDWDSVSDKDEVEKWGTDPLKADTDGDGFNDGFEINAGFNPKGPGKLAP